MYSVRHLSLGTLGTANVSRTGTSWMLRHFRRHIPQSDSSNILLYATTTFLSFVFFLPLSFMSFISKKPSAVPCVLCATLCPPCNILHNVDDYASFYDPRYYPQLHTSAFATRESTCAWLLSVVMLRPGSIRKTTSVWLVWLVWLVWGQIGQGCQNLSEI